MLKALWKALTGSKDIVKTGTEIAKDISSGLDVLVTTEEERIQYNQKAVELYIEFMKTQEDANSIRSRVRRVIACTFTLVYLWFLMLSACLFTLGSGLLLAGRITREQFETFVGTAKYHLQFADRLEWSVLTIIVFYFGPHALQYLKGFFTGRNLK